MKISAVLKIIFLSGLGLTLLGAIIFTVAFAAAGWDINVISTVTAESVTYTEASDDLIGSLSIDFQNADIDVYFDPDATAVTVEYPITKSKRYGTLSEVTLTTQGSTLSLTENQRWQDNWFVIDLSSRRVTVRLPADRHYLNLDIETDNGDITLYGEQCAMISLSLESSNGDIKTNSAAVDCMTYINYATDNGNVIIGKTESQTLSAESDNGDVRLLGALDAIEVSAETNNGDIEFSDAVITADFVTLETDNGDIFARLAGKSADYTKTVETDLGDANIITESAGDKRLTAKTSLGDIRVEFEG
ncbi:MAG: DUF4097 family beta strand repeat protein [Clostridia bacterium]|nr:DUF4097 family beta strand repeat protein [Clostridia bacterium]